MKRRNGATEKTEKSSTGRAAQRPDDAAESDRTHELFAILLFVRAIRFGRVRRFATPVEPHLSSPFASVPSFLRLLP